MKSRRKEEKLEGAVMGRMGRKMVPSVLLSTLRGGTQSPQPQPRQVQRPSPSHSCDQGLNEGGHRERPKQPGQSRNASWRRGQPDWKLS